MVEAAEVDEAALGGAAQHEVHLPAAVIKRPTVAAPSLITSKPPPMAQPRPSRMLL